MEATLGLAGRLGARKMGAKAAPLEWKLRNLTWSFVSGWLANLLGRAFSKITGLPVLTSELRLKHLRAGEGWTDYGVVSRKLITTAGVGLLVDDWQAGTPRMNDMKYVGCGTSSSAAANTDTALIAECTTVLNPDTSRAVGTVTQPSANVCQVVGTLTFDGAAAVGEHGLFSSTTVGVLWDRHNFAAINVVSGDSIKLGALAA